MAKVEFEPGIASVYGILMGTDPFYIRRYPEKDGGVMHIVQARPDRSGHVPSEAERQTRIVFAEQFGRQKHLDFLERKWKGQLEIAFGTEVAPTDRSALIKATRASALPKTSC